VPVIDERDWSGETLAQAEQQQVHGTAIDVETLDHGELRQTLKP
jgi:hypothetical protein